MRTLPWDPIIQGKGDRATNAVPTGTQALTCQREREHTGRDQRWEASNAVFADTSSKLYDEAHAPDPWEGVWGRLPGHVARKNPPSETRQETSSAEQKTEHREVRTIRRLLK